MKTIVVKITTEKVYKIEFDEKVFDKEVIDNYIKYFNREAGEKPQEICQYDKEKFAITEDDYPFFHMAIQIAYLKSEYDSLDNEGMPAIHETIYTKDKNAIYGAYLTDESVDYECEFDLDRYENN
jgi:hypothetical protein